MGEAALVLKKEQRPCRQGCIHRVPVNGVGKVDIEVGDDRPTANLHVRRRSEVSLLHVLEMLDERLLRTTARTRIGADRPLIHDDGEGKAGIGFGLVHHKLRGLIRCAARPIPIDHDAIDAPADHVADLPLDLGGVGGAVADVHVIGSAEPEHQVGIDPGRGARVKQRADTYLAHASRTEIPVRLRREGIGGAGVVGSLCFQRCSGNDGEGSGNAQRCEQAGYTQDTKEPTHDFTPWGATAGDAPRQGQVLSAVRVFTVSRELAEVIS
jgi:hypothetical protein